MKTCCWACAILTLPLLAQAARGEPAVSPAARELRCVRDKPFPVPAGTTPIAVPQGDFETALKVPRDWGLWGGQIVVAGDAPQGKAYCRLKAGRGGVLRTPHAARRAGKTVLPFDVAQESRRALDHHQLHVGRASAELHPHLPRPARHREPVEARGLLFLVPRAVQDDPVQHRAAGGQRRGAVHRGRRHSACAPRPRPKCRPPTRPTGRNSPLATSRRGPATAAIWPSRWPSGKAGRESPASPS